MEKRGVFGFFLFCFLCSFSGMAGAEVLTLEKAIEEARSKSLTLKQSEEMVRGAEAVAAEQRTYLLPSFNLSAIIFFLSFLVASMSTFLVSGLIITPYAS